jgi:hypothetical protein
MKLLRSLGRLAFESRGHKNRAHPTGLEQPEKIDLITFDQATSEYVLIVSATETWEDSDEEQVQLLQKINNYMTFVIDGQLSLHYPQTKGKAIRIQIDSATTIPPNINKLLTQAQKLLLQHDIKLCVNLLY